MSRLNRIRIMNLNYNGNSIRIDDETFDLNGESTLLSLRNGGGKTVLVQMVMSLFVNKAARDFEDRPFKSYFTTARPTLLMTEWVLDHGQGYFLVGMMVRKCQNVEENNNEELELVTFTSAYRSACCADIERLPVVEAKGEGKALKGFGACKREFEELKKNRELDFSYYDMASTYQRRQYFAKLREYQIDHKEWETIIRKVNLKESGLSELFTNAKDEKGLVEKWLLEAVENKLNQGSSRIKEFQSLAYKLIRQYRENQSKLRRKEVIESYFTDSAEITEQTGQYLQAQQKLEQQRSRIAVFIRELNRVEAELGRSLEGEREELERLKRQLRDIEHEKLSCEIYELSDRRRELLAQRIESEKKISQSEYVRREAEKELCLFQCAGLYEEAEDFRRGISGYQAKIQLLMEEQKDREQERRQLGAKLYRCYLEQQNGYERLIQEREGLLSQTEEQREQNARRYEAQLTLIRELSGRMGEKKAAILGYDSEERRFTERFGVELARNILGEYEEGVPELYQKKFQDELTKLHTRITRCSGRLLELKREEEQLTAESEALKVQGEQCRYRLEELRRDARALEEEWERRKSLLPYVELTEKDLDRKDYILERFDRKIGELEAVRAEAAEKQRTLLREYEKLRQGRTVELPEHIAEFFEEQGITYLYGLEWLKKNGRTVKENQRLVKCNPFLPYSIILDGNALERLSHAGKEIYTSVPVPIILRERLEEAWGEAENGVARLGALSFFIMFNSHLLEPAELERLLEEKKQQAGAWKERAERKSEEMAEYRRYRTIIEQQRVTAELLEQTGRQASACEAQQEQIEQAYTACGQRKKSTLREQEEERSRLETAQQAGQRAEQRGQEYQELLNAYERYLSDRRERERLEKRSREAMERAEQLKTEGRELEEQKKQLLEERKEWNRKLSASRAAGAQYQAYQEEPADEQEAGDFSACEARYRAITEGISGSLDELNQSLAEETLRYERKSRELQKRNKYGFQEEDYSTISYAGAEDRLEYLEERIRYAAREENAAREQDKKQEKQLTRLETQLEYAMKRMTDRTGYETPKAREQLTRMDFDARLKLAQYEREKSLEREGQLADRREAFRSTQDAMAEYLDYEALEETEGCFLEQADRAELNRMQGLLRRDLRAFMESREEQRQLTEALLRKIAGKPEYQEDFFRKGFDHLLELVNQVYDLKRQLETILASYESILQKLQVDLASIGKERENIEEIFLDYVRDIDNNLRQIDRNSSIPIRGKSVKMLKLQVPEWEENRELYQARVRDFTDAFLRRGLEAVEESQNVEELLGKIITTKKLYDDVVGIGMIGIRLYKIEAEREVPITWTEVSANSGGEGFLSAFVILSCLLSYMRREDSGLFEAGEEGKVLIMDNPFAQTNAAHLLKPLMDMAKKTNTQLICLSGLGGDSIYSRFDNIYVLNVVNSSMRQGKQYLKSEHIKGEEIRQVIPSQFQTEQLGLFEMEVLE